MIYSSLASAKAKDENGIRRPYIYIGENGFYEEEFMIAECVQEDELFDFEKHYPWIEYQGYPTVISFKQGKPMLTKFQYCDDKIIPLTDERKAVFKIPEQLIYEFKSKSDYEYEERINDKFCDTYIESSHKKRGIYDIPKKCGTCGSTDLQLDVLYSGFMQVGCRCLLCGKFEKLRKIDSNNRYRWEPDEQRRQIKWKEALLSKYGNKCHICGTEKGEMHAHHLIPYSQDANRRFSINNGIILCKECHNYLHKAYWQMNKDIKEYKDIDGIEAEEKEE